MTVHADLLAIRDIGPWLRDVARDAVAPDELESFAMKCELAVQELAVNIVTHGYDDAAGPDDHIELTGTVVDGAVRLVIDDRGKEYRPDDQPAPAADEPQIHGYGLMIVRQLTRRFEHERKNGVNTTTLEFPLPTSGGQA